LHSQKHFKRPTKFKHIMNTTNMIYWKSIESHHHKQSMKLLMIKFKIFAITPILVYSLTISHQHCSIEKCTSKFWPINPNVIFLFWKLIIEWQIIHIIPETCFKILSWNWKPNISINKTKNKSATSKQQKMKMNFSYNTIPTLVISIQKLQHQFKTFHIRWWCNIPPFVGYN